MKYKVGDNVTIVSVVEDHPSGQWQKSMGLLGRAFPVSLATTDEEGNPVYELDLGLTPPWGWGLFWENQLSNA